MLWHLRRAAASPAVPVCRAEFEGAFWQKRQVAEGMQARERTGSTIWCWQNYFLVLLHRLPKARGE